MQVAARSLPCELLHKLQDVRQSCIADGTVWIGAKRRDVLHDFLTPLAPIGYALFRKLIPFLVSHGASPELMALSAGRSPLQAESVSRPYRVIPSFKDREPVGGAQTPPCFLSALGLKDVYDMAEAFSAGIEATHDKRCRSKSRLSRCVNPYAISLRQATDGVSPHTPEA
jgi:hypothetical protein